MLKDAHRFGVSGEVLAGGDGGVGVAPEGGGGLAHVARAAVKAPGAATPEMKQLLSLEDKTTKYAAWNPHTKIFLAKYSCLPKYYLCLPKYLCLSKYS